MYCTITSAEMLKPMFSTQVVKKKVLKHYTTNNKTENSFVTLVKLTICLFILAAVMLLCGQMLHFDGL